MKSRQYWLMIAGDTNCDLLAKLGHPYYALSRMGKNMARSIAVSDRCVLYRARTGKGFIGVFEVTAEASATPTRVGARTYSMRIPWKPLMLAEVHPVELPPLVPSLEFITNKQQFGTYFQTNLKRLSKHDFELIEKAVATNAGANNVIK